MHVLLDPGQKFTSSIGTDIDSGTLELRKVDIDLIIRIDNVFTSKLGALLP